jgi:hypothetical protein
MPNTLFPRFRDAIARYPAATPATGRKPAALPENLLFSRDGDLNIYYAPFEYISPQAKVMLLGITPGLTQADVALRTARAAIEAGETDEVILRQARQAAGFSGSMRAPLIEMLDTVGLNDFLGIASCASLFAEHKDWLQSSSAVALPTFLNGKNYDGSKPKMTAHPLLREMISTHLVPLLRRMEDAVIIPLGPKPLQALDWASSTHGVRPRRVLRGLPHPSGSNAERIAYFVGRKPRERLSNRTNAERLDQAKAGIQEALAR